MKLTTYVEPKPKKAIPVKHHGEKKTLVKKVEKKELPEVKKEDDKE